MADKVKKEQTAPEINETELAKALDEFLGMVSETKIEKADNAEKPGDDEETRGGSDLIKNVKKADEDKEEKDDKKKEDAEKADDEKEKEDKKDDKEMEKADEDKEEKDEDKEEDDKDEEKDDKKKELPAFLKNKMKKSEAAEYEEFLKWKQEKSELAKTEKRETLLSDLKKSLLTESDEKLEKVGQILKALNEKVDRLNGQPARGRKSYESVQVIEKAQGEEGDLKKSEGDSKAGSTETIQKGKLLKAAEQLCKAGLCEVEDITILERTGKITPRLAKAVEQAEQLKKAQK